MVSAHVRRRSQVAYAQRRGVSVRKACALLSVARSTLAIRVAAGEAGRAGGRGDARARRAVSALRLSAHSSVPGSPWPCDERRSDASAVAPARPASAEETAAPARCEHSAAAVASRRALDQVWAYDFVFDACANGQQLKCLTVIDEFTRECLAIDVAGSIRSARVIEVLAKLVSVHGAPTYLRSDNGPEFVSRAILQWLTQREHRHRSHRSGQAVAERLERIVQRQVPRRVPEHAVVQESDRCEDPDRRLPARVQRGSTALEPRTAHAGGVQTEVVTTAPEMAILLSNRWSEESRQVIMLPAAKSPPPSHTASAAGPGAHAHNKLIRER